MRGWAKARADHCSECWSRSTTMLSPSAVHMTMRKVKCVRVAAIASTNNKQQVAAAQRVVALAA